jgi:hypothetical protein
MNEEAVAENPGRNIAASADGDDDLGTISRIPYDTRELL